MVDIIGHLGMALIWLAPAWLFIDGEKTAVTFVAVGFWFGLVPDIDLFLQRVFETIKHHGILHTILAVSLIAVVVGPLVGWLLERALGGSDWFSPEAEDRAVSVGFLMVWIAGLAHIFADILSAPDIAEAIEPFWPLYQQSVGIDLVWYNNPMFNWGLFIVGIGLNVALYYTKLKSNRSSVPEPQ
jgi:MFS family permease